MSFNPAMQPLREQSMNVIRILKIWKRVMEVMERFRYMLKHENRKLKNS